MSDFYLTLLSNASMDIYPNNTTSGFNVHLPKTITLEGRWCLAVTEIHYQYNFLNVTTGHNKTFINTNGRQYECQIPNGYYDKIEDIISELNQYAGAAIPDGDFLELDESTKNVGFTPIGLKHIQDIQFENRLALILGYAPNSSIKPHFLKTILPGDPSRGVPDEMFIYCNIVEPQIVGDEMARIVRIVNIPKKDAFFGQPLHHEYQRLQYIDVAKKQFDTISIELRDKTGAFMAFESGTVTMVIHFKKIA
jgi:hypothetical protein